jgi:hypothetical protein
MVEDESQMTPGASAAVVVFQWITVDLGDSSLISLDGHHWRRQFGVTVAAAIVCSRTERGNEETSRERHPQAEVAIMPQADVVVEPLWRLPFHNAHTSKASFSQGCYRRQRCTPWQCNHLLCRIYATDCCPGSAGVQLGFGGVEYKEL